MDSATIARRFYSKVGAKGLESTTTPAETKALVRTVIRLLPRKGRILDLGCGYGRITIPLSRLGYSIEGIDITPSLVQEARSRAKAENMDTPFHIGDMRNLQYASESYDVVLMLWSSFTELLNEQDQIKTLNEVYRILKPGGFAFIEVRNGEQRNIQELFTTKRCDTNGRLIRYVLVDAETADYLHDRESLRRICSKSRVRRYGVKFKNIGGRRRIVVYLYKDFRISPIRESHAQKVSTHGR